MSVETILQACSQQGYTVNQETGEVCGMAAGLPFRAAVARTSLEFGVTLPAWAPAQVQGWLAADPRYADVLVQNGASGVLVLFPQPRDWEAEAFLQFISDAGAALARAAATMSEKRQKSGPLSFVTGTLGALLGALIGAVPWLSLIHI